jgi:ribosomal 30S subunit maturation factor RimM
MEEMISIGKILNFHGIAGEARVGYSKGKDSQIKALKEVVIKNKKEIAFLISKSAFTRKTRQNL